VVGKCHHCAHRIDRNEPPACVAACPTEALSLRRAEEDENPRGDIPGFADPGHALPSVRFRPPRSGRRKDRLEALTRELRGATEHSRDRQRHDG
jgi:Fe-S-cluster-containing dehydrogenase component